MTGRERIFVPGSHGFFGGWIARALAAAGHEVIGGTRSGREPGTLACELRDPGSVARAVAAAAPTVVVNAAGISSPERARRDPAGCFAANVGGTLHLLEAIRAAAPGARLVSLSSAAVYGPGADGPLDEDAPPAPRSVYGASKLAAELLCGQHAREHGLPVATLRAFNLIGPGQPASQAAAEFAGAVGAALARGRDEARIAVGDPATGRDFTDVRDAAAAVAAVVSSRAEGTFNLCSGRIATLRDLADELAALATERAGRPFTARLAPDPERRPGDPRTLRGSPRRLAAATGWAPETPLARSLADLLGEAARPA